MGRREDLDDALNMQYRILMDESLGVDERKTATEAYKILYQQRMEQEKADQDVEFRESEMVLKEESAKIEKARFIEELAKNDREAKLRKSEHALKRLSTWAGAGTSLASIAIWQWDFKQLVLNEDSIHIIAQRPFMFLKTMEKFALNGVSTILRG
ncbi:MAG: hypothetical protein J6Y02_11310 [Pseudobutyrivibrio sp.]|nr:hypothetical protein [Pseudobutyrivibrio sp.]